MLRVTSVQTSQEETGSWLNKKKMINRFKLYQEPGEKPSSVSIWNKILEPAKVVENRICINLLKPKGNL